MGLLLKIKTLEDPPVLPTDLDACLDLDQPPKRQFDLDASVITLPMVGQSSPVSPKRRMSSNLFSKKSTVSLTSAPSISGVIPPPVLPPSTPASGTTHKFVIIFEPSTAFSVRSSRAMCKTCSEQRTRRYE
ncbi:hypothetical protein AHF37_09960 [Paragonimus kellicotti]|nr:hypothetical protein AHF37_09960 [Paragonimus kellicotti]